MTFTQINDPVFGSYFLGNAPVKQLATGFDWVEGPVWFGDANHLLFLIFPTTELCDGALKTGLAFIAKPSNFSNGHTRDLMGRLISCEHGRRRVTRTEHDGTITVLADKFDGKSLNSPNDVVVKSDGTIWFTDPHYGIMTNYEGFKSEEELPCQLYRLDPETGDLSVIVSDMACPNGLAFSADESILYVADTGRIFDETAEQHIKSYKVNADGKTVSGGAVFHTVDQGCADGFRLDEDGNIWTSAGDGVHCISPSGKLLGKILVPEVVSNVCFGGRGKHQLFITATTSLYRVSLNRSGIQKP